MFARFTQPMGQITQVNAMQVTHVEDFLGQAKIHFFAGQFVIVTATVEQAATALEAAARLARLD